MKCEVNIPTNPNPKKKKAYIINDAIPDLPQNFKSKPQPTTINKIKNKLFMLVTN
jgi:hypothetical protein